MAAPNPSYGRQCLWSLDITANNESQETFEGTIFLQLPPHAPSFLLGNRYDDHGFSH